jgi:ubiquinone/menaquinone biosynthesis C-methylase UbiE
MMHITNQSTILDVGGLPHDWLSLNFTGQVICVSLSQIREGPYGNGNIIYLRQDATTLPYRDQQFDVVFSNSLLEHVGRENQLTVSKEIQRVGRSYWVQTPHRNFPLEPHYRAPFFYQLPYPVRKFVATYWTSMIRKQNHYLNELDTIHLLTTKELKTFFPQAKIVKEKFFGLTKSIIAVKTPQMQR